MGFLERQFRAQFTPYNEGYSLRDRGADYWFDAEEVEQFVVEWRRHWANPLVWAAYLVVGVALPAWLYYQGLWGGAFVIGTVAGIAMLVNLCFPLRQPYDLAAARRPLKEAVPWRPPTGSGVLVAFGFAAAMGLFAWFSHKAEDRWFNHSDIIPIFFALHLLWIAGADFVLWRRAKGISLKPFSEEKAGEFRAHGIYFALSIIAIAVWLSPDNDWWGRAGSIGLLMAVGAAETWKLVREKADVEAEAS